MRPLKYLVMLFIFALPLNAAAVHMVTFTTAPLSIRTQTGELHFTVEEATSEVQHEYGLMYRKSLPDMHGMIFIFDTVKPVGFWMKNTLIPLDMLFVDEKGIITRITANATPESTDLITSGGPVRAVIEVMGGTAEHYHIAKGDKVIYPVFP